MRLHVSLALHIGRAELASEEFAALGEGDVIFVEQSERLQRTAERPGSGLHSRN